MNAGANLIVAGSYVFRSDLENNVKRILRKIDKISQDLD